MNTPTHPIPLHNLLNPPPIIAGIGSRQTPQPILKEMERIGRWCREQGIYVRSGHADGADMAFEKGAEDHCTAYIPWRGFNKPSKYGAHLYVLDDAHRLAKSRAESSVDQFHPRPQILSAAVRKLMARNYLQVFGAAEEENPVRMVVCWTPQGLGGGGTGQAIRIAKARNIQVIDLAIEAFIW